MKDVTRIGHVLQMCVQLLPFPPSFKYICFTFRMDYHLTKTQFETQYFYISTGKKETSCSFSAFLLQREKTRAIP